MARMRAKTTTMNAPRGETRSLPPTYCGCAAVALLAAAMAGPPLALAQTPNSSSLGPLQATAMVTEFSREGGILLPAAGWYGIYHGPGHRYLYARPLDGGPEVALRVMPPLVENDSPRALIVTRKGFLVSGHMKVAGEGRLKTVVVGFDRGGRPTDIFSFGSQGYNLHVVAGDELPDGRLAILWKGVRSPEGRLEVGLSLFDENLRPVRDLVPAVTIPRSQPNSITRQLKSAVRWLGDEIWVVDAITGRVMLLSATGKVRHTVRVGMEENNETILGWAPAADGVHVLLIVGMERPLDAIDAAAAPPCWQQRLVTLAWDGGETAAYGLGSGRGPHPSCTEEVAFWMFPDRDGSQVVWQKGNLWRGRWQRAAAPAAPASVAP